MRVAILCMMALFAAAAEEVPQKTRAQVLAERQKLYPELMRVVELTQGVPPEFAAAALLRVAETPFLADREWIKELADEAFRQASRAKEPMRKALAAPVLARTSRAALAAQSSSTGLDRLTLQMQATRIMLAVDPVKARETFTTVGAPRVAKASCEDVVVDNPSAYFETLARVVDSGFTTGEKQKDLHAQLLAGELRRITSPVEVGPAARALMATALTPPQFEMAVAALGSALQKISGDDRSFSAVLLQTDQDLTNLLSRARTSGVSAEGLTSAYRQYLTANFKGARCEDTVGSEKAPVMAQIGGSGSAAEPEAPRFLGIDPDGLKPAKVSGKPKEDRALNSHQSDAFRKAFYELMFGEGSRGLTAEEKKSHQWQERFYALVNSVAEMKAEEGESRADYFYRKSGTYFVALTAAPPGPDRDKLVAQYIAFLRTSDMQELDIAGWFSQVKALVDLTYSLDRTEQSKLFTALSNSGAPVLRLYGEQESVLPHRPDWARR